MAKKRKNKFRSLLIIFLLLACVGLAAAWYLYSVILLPNVNTGDKKSVVVLVPTGADFSTLKDSLYRHDIIKNKKNFEMLAKKKGLTENVKPGRYRILKSMGNNELVNLFRGGLQEPVDVVINSYLRTKGDLAGRLGRVLEPDSASFMEKMNDPEFASRYGFSTETILTMILPDTYEFYWTTGVDDFFDRMASEYKTFWSDERKAKARRLEMDQSEVSILASIVQKETTKGDEKPKIAGVYLNRLRINMALQADPTLVFAAGDFTIRRVLKAHREIDSPYNTYRYTGLPPGPICIPSKNSIDAVLNAEKHNYLYFVASSDFSGYHVFSRNYSEHMGHARKYQQELTRRKIMK